MKKIYTICFLLAVEIFSSCEEFVEPDSPKTQIISSDVFSNDAGARAAVIGIFSQMMSSSAFASGNNNSITMVAGLSADELNNNSTSQDRIALYNNNLTSLNSNAVSSNWNDMFLYVYEANLIIEGTTGSAAISREIRDQVIGEAKFIRAFSYFYLVNLYGDVPWLISTDYRINREAKRTPVSEVYGHIEEDLKEAQNLLKEDYSFSLGEKVEPNKWAATALLARAYLYQRKWSDAEQQASAIIESATFSMEPDLNSVFLANSGEAIWQLMPVFSGYNTNEAPQMVIVSNPTRVSLASSVLSQFEADDQRAKAWVGSYTTGSGVTYNYVYKYKINVTGEPVTEYYTVFRLAEQYLIRAEARAMQSNLTGAIEDLNEVHERAGLNALDAAGLSQQQVLDLIEKERRRELFVEWGHRWFDLKRTGKIDEVLGAVKPDWQPKDALFPIPQNEINTNPNLVQNP